MFFLGILIGGVLGFVVAGLTMSAKEASERRKRYIS
jgi:gas vesicle protein